MNTVATVILKNAEELVQQRSFQEALRLLEEIDLGSISSDQQAQYLLLRAESKISLGDYQVIGDLGDAIEYYKRSHQNDKFALGKFLHGLALVYTGNYLDAREVLNEAYAGYKRIDDTKKLARISAYLGLVGIVVGDVDTAIFNAHRSMILFRELKEYVNADIAESNIGYYYAMSGRIGKATAIYKHLYDHVVEWFNPGNIANYYILYSLPLALKGETKSAREMLQKAFPHIGEHARQESLYHQYSGWIFLMEGRYAEARDDLIKALRLSKEIAPYSPEAAESGRRLAEAYLGLGNYADAKACADEALEVAEKLSARLEISGCCRVFAGLAVHDGKREAARQHFEKAIDIHRRIQAWYELALTRYQMAISGMYDLHERNVHLHLAREYFEREQVGHYVKKIDIELSSTPVIARGRSKTEGSPPIIVAANREMKRLLEMARHVAPSEMTILLTGPTGCGKDMFARFIHHNSTREGRFVSVNTAAIPESMIESELFGHRRGAFTSAERDKVGLVEVAEGGTLYLNEIADASLQFQAKLLDVIESRSIRRLGETNERDVDFRLIAATNHDLEKLVQRGKFRIDLYHRLSELPLTLPPLKDRPEDIRPLLVYFFEDAGIKIDEGNRDLDKLVRMLIHREWPGNVRQLQAEARRMALLTGGNIDRMIQYLRHNSPSEREQLRDLLESTNWNRREAARRLGVSDTTIRRRMKKYGLDDG